MSEMAKSEPQEPAAAKGRGCSKPEEDFVLRFNLRAKASTMLYPHQRQGIKWVCGCKVCTQKEWRKILGDDLGTWQDNAGGFSSQECAA